MNDRGTAGFFDGVFDRTLSNLRTAWRGIAESARGVLGGPPRPDLPRDDAGRLLQPFRRAVAKPVELLDAGAVAEVEVRHRVESASGRRARI